MCPVLGCAPKSERNSQKVTVAPLENERRRLEGLREIESSWYSYKIDSGEEVWKLDSNAPFELKRLFRSEPGKIVWEQDYYHTGRKFFINGSDQTWEFLAVYFDYNAGQMRVDYVGPNSAAKGLLKSHKGVGVSQEAYETAKRIAMEIGIRMAPRESCGRD